MCRCFLFLFDVVFLIFESSPSGKLLQLNLFFFNALCLHWMFSRLNSSSLRNIFLLHRIFAYYVRTVVTFFKVLSERWISLFAVGILLLPSIQFLSKLFTSLHFSVQEIIDWSFIALFFLTFFVRIFHGFNQNKVVI